MKLIYAFMAVIILFVVINVSFSSSRAENTRSLADVEINSNRVSIEQKWEVIPDDSLNKILDRAIWDNDKAAVESVLKQGADVNHVNTTDGYAPIHWAVERGFSDIVAVLISSGANVDMMTNGAIGKDRTALHIAAETGNPEIVRILLENGANVNSRTEYQETPLHGVRLFVKNVDVISLLIDAGADVNATTIFGSTPLHSASIIGVPEIVSLLIDKGASPNSVNKRGLTPLHQAAQRGHEEIVNILLAGAAILDTQTRNGDTALHVAAKKGHAGIVDQLLKAGANPFTLNKFSKSALQKLRIGPTKM